VVRFYGCSFVFYRQKAIVRSATPNLGTYHTSRRMELYGGDGGKALNLSDFQVSSTPDDDASILLANTNKLLTAVGISAKRIETTEELARVASSLFVAVYESLFHQRITGVVRNPQTRNDYERNAQLVIDSLSDQIQLDLKHITGRSIVSGDLRVLSNLVHILVRIVSLTRYVCPMYLFLHGTLLTLLLWQLTLRYSQESLTSYDSSVFDEGKNTVKFGLKVFVAVISLHLIVRWQQEAFRTPRRRGRWLTFGRRPDIVFVVASIESCYHSALTDQGVGAAWWG
jgi:hypothetical protein